MDPLLRQGQKGARLVAFDSLCLCVLKRAVPLPQFSVFATDCNQLVPDTLSHTVFSPHHTFTSTSQAFGAPIASLQTIKHRLATLKTEIVIGRTFADRCIELLSEKKLDNATASMAKYWLTDLQNKVCTCT